MVKLKLNAQALAAAWHGPEKHRVRFAAIVAALSAVVLGGAATAGLAKETFRETASAPQAVAQPAPVLTKDQQELVAITHAVEQAPLTYAEQARRINASMPFSSAPVRAAKAFTLVSSNPGDFARALDCLTQAIYYEAAFEPIEGRRAVGQVVLNRMRHPAFPKTVCGVVFEGASRPGCQFSFACDGSLGRPPAPGAWREARQVAEAALRGAVMKGVGQATHYHTDYVAPYWAPKLTKITRIGAHIFYRWPGGWGEPAAFNGRYAGFEQPFAASKQAPLPADVLVVAEAPVTPIKVEDPTDRRAPNDIGGRLDTDKGWKLDIPLPTESKSSLSNITAAQDDAGAGA